MLKVIRHQYLYIFRGEPMSWSNNGAKTQTNWRSKSTTENEAIERANNLNV